MRLLSKVIVASLLSMGAVGSASDIENIKKELISQKSKILLLEQEKANNSDFSAMVVYNSVANTHGNIDSTVYPYVNTLKFWQIPYADRFKEKGINTLHTNYYNPILYLVDGAATYVDVIEDITGKSAIVMIATADSIDKTTMKFSNPIAVFGDAGVFDNQFSRGWSASDFDGDSSERNCASIWKGVSQHYGKCWRYNLGADDEIPREDDHWGPHAHNGVLRSFQLKVEESGGKYSRVKRITRYRIFANSGLDLNEVKTKLIQSVE
ncbi:hypothetical protein [Pseudobacteriovorax antillogorgiicola]|uniref:Uncharacterized protein n=1 Tax=Pseudobacteriovorax antillogorgiicola TaxID=1513793 RepID=A0A1Y6BZU2_9BACT|nr:hypothetical protein [Pseudobacteriovorax antillogorgiicola]TCS51137.1 hypothetical protein EDD56_11118 [Pseudobacteriovorax antillogorgiicola]SMF38404.1 hypothetical protein SAMN06296036_111159 [Pseudobacteriovorax antillogorgiicola]